MNILIIILPDKGPSLFTVNRYSIKLICYIIHVLKIMAQRQNGAMAQRLTGTSQEQVSQFQNRGNRNQPELNEFILKMFDPFPGIRGKKEMDI